MVKLKSNLPNTRVVSSEIFKLYCAIKAHMQGTFDYTKRGTNINFNQKTFEKRNDVVFFERLSHKLTMSECHLMFVSNFAANSNAYSFELADSNAREFHLDHTRYLERFHHHFRDEVKYIFDLLAESGKSFKDLFGGEGHPVILQLALQHSISIETFICLNRIFKFVDLVNTKYKDDIMWCDFKKRAQCYERLLTFDDVLIKTLFIQVKDSVS